MSILITTEATADIPSSLFRDDLKIIPMGYTVKGVGYDGDKEKLSCKEFYDVVATAKTPSDLPQTTMVTAFAAEEFFTKYLSEGYDIIHIAFSSHLSGTYEQIKMAEKVCHEKFPERKLTVIDSFAASFVEGMIAYYTCQEKDKGASYEELVAYVEKIRYNAAARFVIDDLNHLCRTGRASRSEAFFGSALHIKPILYIPNDGSLVPFKKAISSKKAFRAMLEDVEKHAWKGDDKLIAVGCADADEDRQFLIDQIKQLGFTNVIPYDVGPVIGTHVGKGMVSVIFLADSRELN